MAYEMWEPVPGQRLLKPQTFDQAFTACKAWANNAAAWEPGSLERTTAMAVSQAFFDEAQRILASELEAGR